MRLLPTHAATFSCGIPAITESGKIAPDGTVTTFAGGSSGNNYQGTGTNVTLHTASIILQLIAMTRFGRQQAFPQHHSGKLPVAR
jgi:hypothetical protein